MQKTEKNLNYLMMVFAILLITANVIASKIMDLGFTLFGNPVTLTAGALCYPFVSMITDTINEKWGDKVAKQAVIGGFLCQFISTAFIVIAGFTPAAAPEMQDAYMMTLGQSWVFVVASLTAYLVSSFTDIFVFGAIRKAQEAKGVTEGKGRSIRAYISTIIGQLIDSTIFVGIAFGLGFGWIWNGQLGAMLNMILAQWLIKTLLSYIGIPMFLRMTAKTKQ